MLGDQGPARGGRAGWGAEAADAAEESARRRGGSEETRGRDESALRVRADDEGEWRVGGVRRAEGAERRMAVGSEA